MGERGAGKLSLIIAVALGVGFSASVFLNYQQHERMEQERKLLHGEITDLRYQVQQDQIALNGGEVSPSPSPSTTPSPSPSPSTTPAPTPTPAVAGASARTMRITEPANFRSAPSKSASLVPGVSSKLPAGTVVTVVDPAPVNGYWHVSYNGKTGYIVKTALAE